MTLFERSIIRTLLYFDLFDHPLDGPELYEMIDSSPDPDEFRRSLASLADRGFIGHHGGYYYIQNGHSPVEARLERLQRSDKYMRIAQFMSHLIYQHPFVRAVMVSGSLSKSSIARKDDIDFFIIAEPGRVWICRAFLMLFKKIFLLNSKKYFCINYFIASDALAIHERNLFTATELSFLKPLQNRTMVNRFMQCNAWIRDFFPNKETNPNDGCQHRDLMLKRFLEWLFRGKAGRAMDAKFLGLYRKRAERRFGQTDRNRFQVNFKTERDVAKYHPQGFQHQILDRYAGRISAYEARFGIRITEQEPDLHG
jgi:hypothetical protein